jgi:putative heme-binding domain-containing protein
MWGVHLTGGFSEKELILHLSDTDPHVRAWAIQLLCEDFKAPQEAVANFTSMAKSDPSPVVRLNLATSLQRMAVKDQWAIAEALLKHKEDQNDHNLPKMIWYGTEHLIDENPEKFLSLASQSQLPMVSRFMARRVVDGDQTDKLVAALSKNPANQVHLLEGMLAGMEGRTDLEIPSTWPALAKKLDGNKSTQQLSQSISELFGDAEATKRSFATLSNKQAPIAQRISALRTLTAQQRPELVSRLPELMTEKEMRSEAILAIAAFDQESLGKLLIKEYPTFSLDEKNATLQTLSSRSRYGNLLAQEIKAERIPKREIPANIARQLLRVVGSGFIEIWGPIEQVAHDKAAYEKYQSILTKEALTSANIQQGKSLFQQTCGSCHKMFGEGADLGPDLTGSNRTDVDYILLNVLEPSAEIQDAYKMVVITTRDGRTYTGNVIGENQRQLTLRVVGQDPVIINKSTIQSREVTPVSLMPPGLFEQLSDKEVVDLVAYLQSPKAIP